MLVLSRRVGEWINVDGPCSILISQIQDQKVRIGIEAKSTVLILRGELSEYPPHPVDDVRDRFQSGEGT